MKLQNPHTLCITVLLISEGLKKLRRLHVNGDAGTSPIDDAVCFWRGMKGLCLPDAFDKEGGTELQCMSTTADVNIAGQYGQSNCPLIFCVKFDKDFMKRGADISWLSLYPHENGIFYPPLTYLRYLGARRIMNSKGSVVYVEPSIGG